MKPIPLTQGKVARVDDHFYEPLMAIGSWSYHTDGYAQCKVKGRTILMHRAVWNLAGRRLPRRPRLLDHRDTDGLNNQLDNLRPATRSQNMHHSGPSRRNKSGFKGVSFVPCTKKWVARIRIRGVNRHLGTYKTPRKAALAYDEVAFREVGEFAYLNFPTTAA